MASQPRSAARSTRRPQGPGPSPPRSRVASTRGRRPAARRGRTGEPRPLANVGGPLRLALTLSFAGFALAGAAWRAGWRS